MAHRIRVPAAATVKLTREDLRAVEELKIKLQLQTLSRTDVIRLVIQRALAATENAA